MGKGKSARGPILFSPFLFFSFNPDWDSLT